MKSTGYDEPTKADGALEDGRRPGTPPRLIRDLIIFTSGFALLAGWYVFRGLKYPEHRHHDLLWAVLCLLYAVGIWVHRPIGGRLASMPNSSYRGRWSRSFRFLRWASSHSTMWSSRAGRWPRRP